MESNEPITNESKNINISDLKSFTIRGLFGYKDIVLPLDKEVLILIAENGAGKTNILNILCESLTSKIVGDKCLNCHSTEIEFSRKISEKIKYIDFNILILYFTTYRRIEEDLSNLVGENFELEYNITTLIKFGMEDVKEQFEEIQAKIKNTAFELFSRVTGEMLTQFIEGLDVTPEMRESIDINILDLILSRVGEQNISKTEQEKIKNLVTSGKINDPQYDNLVYFLSKLINLYESQSEIEETIKSFVTVCNKYLNPSKQIIYNESTAEIYIKQTRNNETIELNNLSSGEKQIISLFSKVYLEAEEDFILIIDEPELSISVEWQQMLLPDIMNSGKCKRLIAATHSPFIFDNELDHCAYALNQFVTEH